MIYLDGYVTILINRGSYFTMSALVNVLTKAVAGPAALPRINEAGNRAARLQCHFGNAVQKILCSSDSFQTKILFKMLNLSFWLGSFFFLSIRKKT